MVQKCQIILRQFPSRVTFPLVFFLQTPYSPLDSLILGEKFMENDKHYLLPLTLPNTFTLLAFLFIEMDGMSLLLSLTRPYNQALSFIVSYFLMDFISTPIPSFTCITFPRLMNLCQSIYDCTNQFTIPQK